MKIQIRVPGKLILLGEYAVLEGADALVASVDRYLYTEISESGDDCFRIISSLASDPLRVFINKRGDFVADPSQPESLINTMKFSLLIMKEVYHKYRKSGIKVKPFNLRIDTSQFYIDSNTDKIGLGSSAAITVALIAAISRYLGNEMNNIFDTTELFRFACNTHFKIQGSRGSGIDIAASIFGGINIYNIASLDPPDANIFISPVPIINDLYILPVWTGISASTINFLIQVEKFKTEFKSEYKEAMNRLMVLSERGCVSFKKRNVSDFLNKVRDYYTVLLDFSKKSGISIISEIHREIADIVYSAGGVYKSSGAGGGDIGIVFSDSELIIEKIKKNLLKNNYNPLPLKISAEGIVVNTA